MARVRTRLPAGSHRTRPARPSVPTRHGVPGHPLRGWRSDLRAAVAPWLLARALVAMGAVVALIAAERLVADRPVPLDQGLLAWDGAAYRDIAARGYDVLPDEVLRFFPLFPLAGRILAFGSERFAGLGLVVVANVAAYVAMVLAHRLARLELGERVAALVPWLMALYPAAFVLVLAYSEALVLVAALACFLALRQQRWWVAALAGVLAGGCRPLGVVLVLPALVEVLRDLTPALRARRGRELLARTAAVVAPLAGLGAYLAYAGIAAGDWWAPVRIQGTFRGDLVEPVTRLLRAIGEVFSAERLGDGLHAPFALGLVALVVVAARRLPLSYTLYSAALVILSISAENLNSLERYGLNAFPLLFVVAIIATRLRITAAVLAASAGMLVAFTALAYLGAYVP